MTFLVKLVEVFLTIGYLLNYYIYFECILQLIRKGKPPRNHDMINIPSMQSIIIGAEAAFPVWNQEVQLSNLAVPIVSYIYKVSFLILFTSSPMFLNSSGVTLDFFVKYVRFCVYFLKTVLCHRVVNFKFVICCFIAIRYYK